MSVQPISYAYSMQMHCTNKILYAVSFSRHSLDQRFFRTSERSTSMFHAKHSARYLRYWWKLALKLGERKLIHTCLVANNITRKTIKICAQHTNLCKRNILFVHGSPLAATLATLIATLESVPHNRLLL